MQPRILFVTRYKGLLIVLVVLAHTGITYGASGSWYYTEQHGELWVKALGTFIAAVARSFATGAFFFLSAYFLPGSLANRGEWDLIRQRAVRLLIPLGIFTFLANPLLVMAVASWGTGLALPPRTWFGPGPLWFVGALFVLTIVYIAGKRLFPRGVGVVLPSGVPSRRAIAVYILVAAGLGFAVRVAFPIGRTVANLQPGFFPMYILLFAAGVKAGREQWLDDIASLPIGMWCVLAAVGLLLFPTMTAVEGARHDTAAFLGGFTWQSAAYALWEAGMGTSLFLVTLVMFARARWMAPGVGESFSTSSYGIYLLHAFVVILLALAMKNVLLHPFVKWATVSICAVCLPWAATRTLRKLPGFSRVL